MTRKVWLFCLLLIPGLAFSQKKADRELAAALKKHLVALQNPKDSAPVSAAKRLSYLTNQFHDLGTIPRGPENRYTQALIINQARRFEPGTTLEINGQSLKPDQDFVPLSYSDTGSVKGSPLIAVQERKQPWIIDLGNYFDDTPTEAVFKDSLYRLASQAVTDQATAVLFYNSHPGQDAPADIHFEASPGLPPLTIPVVYLRSNASSRYLKDPTASVEIRLRVSFLFPTDTAYTVLAGIDNGAPETVIVAASTTEDKAMLIELARILKDSRQYGRENYLFVAFPEGAVAPSAIKHFSHHLPAEAGTPGCLLWLDDAAGSTLTIHGLQSSAGWKPLLERIKQRSPLRRTNASPDSGFIIADVPELSFTGSGADQPDALSAVVTVRFLSSLLENLNRRGSSVWRKKEP